MVPLHSLARSNVAQSGQKCGKAEGLDLGVQVECSGHVVPQGERYKNEQATTEHDKVRVAISIQQRLDNQKTQCSNHHDVIDLVIPRRRPESEGRKG